MEEQGRSDHATADDWRRRGGARGQSTLEYAIVIAIMAAAIVTMQIYMKHGLQGKFRQATDDIGEGFSPSVYSAKFKTVQKSDTKETLHIGESPGKGESKSKTILDGISTTRTSLEPEVLTDPLANDKVF